MIAPLFFIVVIFVLVALPAALGWKLVRNHDQSVRMAGAVLAGQIILTPGVAYFSLVTGDGGGDNPMRTVLIYAGMALVISIMTFAILEIKNTRASK